MKSPLNAPCRLATHALNHQASDGAGGTGCALFNASRPALLCLEIVRDCGMFQCARSFPRGRGKPHPGRVRSPEQVLSSRRIVKL